MTGASLSTVTRPLTALGAVCAFVGVALGAFGAHALKSIVPVDRMATYHTGVEYHLAHALGILLVASLADRLQNGRLLMWCGRLMAAGIVLFSGSLYALAITGVKLFGAITPLGGVCFLTAWGLLVVAALRFHR